MAKFRFEIDLWSSDGTFRSYNPKINELYDKWQESQSDEDFEKLADWAASDIASDLDFCVVNIERIDD